MQIRVDPQELVAASQSMSRAGHTLAGVDLAAEALRVMAAMPGSASAITAMELASTWRDALGTVCARSRVHALELHLALDGYDRSERLVTDELLATRQDGP